jgi:hypothetical protein
MGRFCFFRRPCLAAGREFPRRSPRLGGSPRIFFRLASWSETQAGGLGSPRARRPGPSGHFRYRYRYRYRNRNRISPLSRLRQPWEVPLHRELAIHGGFPSRLSIPMAIAACGVAELGWLPPAGRVRPARWWPADVSFAAGACDANLGPMHARFAMASAAGGRPAPKPGKARGIVPGNMVNMPALLPVKSSHFAHDAANLFIIKMGVRFSVVILNQWHPQASHSPKPGSGRAMASWSKG